MNTVQTGESIKALPSSVPGTRLFIITDPYMLVSPTGIPQWELAYLFRTITVETGNDNDVHVAIVLPEATINEMLPQLIRVSTFYTDFTSNDKADIRRVVINWYGTESVDESKTTIASGSLSIGKGERKLTVSLITQERLEFDNEAAWYALHTYVLDTFAPIPDPQDARDTWPTGDFDAALTAWTTNPVPTSQVVSVEYISRTGEFERQERKLYVSARIADTLD